MNQPPRGAASKKIEPQRKIPPSTKHQKPKADRRGKGRSRAPSICGRNMIENGLEDRHGEEKHHHRAVQREDLVVAVGGEKVVVGHGELEAHQQREHAAEEEEDEGGGRVPEADLRVVDLRPVAPAFRHLPRPQQALFLGALHLLGRGLGERFGIAVCQAHSSPSR